MAQEEKFEEAKRLYETANADQRYVLESLFPELAESEDERMKSAAIEFVIQNKSFNYYLGISKDNVVTWINRQGEQKAWTEEDKNMLKWVIGYLENKMLNTPISEERTACKNAIAWLEEKLKGEQKPVAWSEEDERFLNVAINILNSSKVYTKSPDKYEDTINWLKDIKDRVQPQPQWKPSYEQVSVLEFIMEDIEKDSIRYTVLNSILEQLMKLVEK